MKNNIEEHRKRYKLTQEELAMRLAKYLDVRVEELFILAQK